MAKKKKQVGRRNQGDVDAPNTVTAASGPADSTGPAGATNVKTPTPNGATANKARALESRFAKLSPTALENLSLIAAYTPLDRPVRRELAILTPERIDASTSASAGEGGSKGGGGGGGAFRLPKKPRWHRDLSAKAVQSNESSVFSSWLEETDAAMDTRFSLVKGLLSSGVAEVKHLPRPRAEECLLPSMFERNVEVYRQLWRVMERSHLLLVLLDARCPLLHLPPSLVEHLRKYAAVKTILVLTKKDIVGEEVALAWKRWLEERFGWSVVVTESYRRQEKREGQGE